MQGGPTPDGFMAQRNAQFVGGKYDQMHVFDPIYHRTAGEHYADGAALASTSGSSSSASHNVMPHGPSHWTPNMNGTSTRGIPTTPPRTNWHANQHGPNQQQVDATTFYGNPTPGSMSRFTDGRTRTSVNPPVHYRTNFGKNCSYFPPETKSSPVGPMRDLPPSPKRPPPSALENLARAKAVIFNEGQTEDTFVTAPPSDRFTTNARVTYVPPHVAQAAPSPWDEDDVPFDQQRDMYRPPGGNFFPTPGNSGHFDDSSEMYLEPPPSRAATSSQSDWEMSSPNRPTPLRTYYSETDESITGRFQISPPRVTDPTPLPFQSRIDLDGMGQDEILLPPTSPGIYHRPGGHLFNNPFVNGEVGYDSMEAECSPSQSASLYSPYSQTTRGSQFKWPDDSPRSKALDSPASRQRDASSLTSPKSVRSAKDETPRFGTFPLEEELLEDNLLEEELLEQHLGMQNVLEILERDDAEATEDYESHHSNRLNATDTQGPNYPSLVTLSHESNSQDQSDQRSSSPQDEPNVTSTRESSEPEMGLDLKSAPPVTRIIVETKIDEEGSWDDEAQDEFPDPEDDIPPSSSAGEDDASPRSVRKKNSANTDDDSIFVFSDDDKPAKPLSPSEKLVISPRHMQARNKAPSSARRGRRRATEGDEDDDDTSLENDYGEAPKRSSSLQERAQQAWASRKAVVHRAQSIPPGVTVSEPKVVSVINSRQDEEDEVTALTGTTGVTGKTSVAGSLNSLYTKTLESEVEDAIKDLLLIGTGRATNPGRRANKFQPNTKRLLKEGEDNSSAVEDEATDGTPVDDEDEDLDDTAREEKKESDSNPIQMMWEYVEGNLSVIGSAFGLAPEAKVKTKPKTKERGSSSTEEGSTLSRKAKLVGRERGVKVASPNRKSHDDGDGDHSKPISSQASSDSVEDCELNEIIAGQPSRSRESEGEATSCTQESHSQVVEKFVEGSKHHEPEKIISTDVANENLETDDSSAIAHTVTYSFHAMSVSVSVCESVESENHDAEVSSRSPTADGVSVSVASQTAVDSALSAPSSRNAKLEEDPRLIELALEAARSLHQLAGVEFDDSSGVDIVEDIKFSIVKLPLPLGILFQENYGGCWVTRILPSGNAAKIGGVELGDQLAAVNGVSAIKAKVDEVCTLVSEAAHSSSVELTFLRYIGPLRILPSEEEDEVQPEILEEPKHRDHFQTENVFGCVIGNMKDEAKSQTDQEKEDSKPEEKPRQELSELQPSSTKPTSKIDATPKESEGKKRFRFFGIGRKKKAIAMK